mmetsp:Transcript_9498/g.24634  ORF Transcript_9498/g.24634 Transcript_9498/m.24634 type:complete len:102 (+) Transcript_9498:1536-1841(+)
MTSGSPLPSTLLPVTTAFTRTSTELGSTETWTVGKVEKAAVFRSTAAATVIDREELRDRDLGVVSPLLVLPPSELELTEQMAAEVSECDLRIFAAIARCRA